MGKGLGCPLVLPSSRVPATTHKLQQSTLASNIDASDKGMPASLNDTFLANYDREIFNSPAAQLYAGSGFYNIGYWKGQAKRDSTALVEACRMLLHHMARADLTAERSVVSDVLDVGCGLGATTATLASIYPNARVSGINLSARQIDHARARCPTADFHDGRNLHELRTCKF